MSLFPTTARQRLGAACVAGALAIGAATAPLAHADDLKHRQRHVQHQISSTGHDLDESSSRLRSALGALNAAKSQLRSARHDLRVARSHAKAAKARDVRMQAALALAVQKLDTARSDLAAGQQAASDQRQQLVDTVTGLYESGDPQLVGLSALMAAQTPADLTRRHEANSVVLDQQDADLDSLRAAEVLLSVRTTQLGAAKAEVARSRAAAHANLVQKRAYRAQALAAKDRVAGLVWDRRTAAVSARDARAHDRVQLRHLRVKERQIHYRIMVAIAKARAAARRAAARAVAARRATARAHSNHGYAGDSGGFLLRPVPGYITSPYGWRIHPIYHYWGLHDGDDFHAPCGTALHASGGGKVIAEYYSSVWGNRLYLNVGMVNGKFITVIYNHLERYAVGTGATVSRGQTVGYAGTTGWSTGCHLHFTVMANGTPVDPTPWFG
ncbi:MAG: peptidoglycan DD-metalloendopeptidase family protein [Nocardioides sp.]